MPRREATWTPASPTAPAKSKQALPAIGTTLHTLLSHPNIASKHWIIRQYDHEVQGNTIQKPLVGPGSRGPGDAAVLEPVPGSNRGIAVGCGLALGVGDPARGGDPYQMALAGIDEAVRNLVCTGVDPTRIAILDNFCWPSCGKPTNLGLLVRACAGCYDGAKAYRTPFVSGKDSLNNQLSYVDSSGTQRVIEIPPTLLITGLGIVTDLNHTTTSDAKHAGNVLLLIGQAGNAIDLRMGGSTFAERFGLCIGDAAVPTVDLSRGPRTAALMHQAIKSGWVKSAHDCSEGGLLVTIAEMLIGSANGSTALGFDIEHAAAVDSAFIWAFAESASRYVIEVAPADLDRVLAHFASIGVTRLGTLNSSAILTWKSTALSESVDSLTTSWRATLDW
jgi:phosphoribosylformylglycinamidine synthase